MNIIVSVFMIALIGTLVFTPAYFENKASALDEDAPRILKQNALTELASLDVSDKKDQKKIKKAIKQIEKSLAEKLWMDDITLTMKGKKVFDNNKKAVKELIKIKSVDVSDIIAVLVESDRLLAQYEIDSIPTDTGLKKVDKQLSKANKEFDKAQKKLDKNKFDKAIDHFKKAWKHIALKGLDVIDSENESLDIDRDGLIDYYFKTLYTGKSKKPFVVDYKIQDECVDLGPKDPSDVGGDTYEDAAMKVGVSTIDRVWLTSEPTVWNDWFKKNDENKKIDLITMPPVSFPPLDEGTIGDNVIQSNGKKNSFTHVPTINELSSQSGWEGTMFFNAPPGDYILWTFHPGGGLGGCDILSGLGIFVTISE